MIVASPSRARLRFLLITLAVSAGSSSTLSAQRDKDVKGSKDHPMISRIEGSIISTFNQKEFDEYRLVKGPVSGYAPDGQGRKPQEALDENNSLRLEGRVWQFTYDIPVNRSTLEIARNYEAALSKAGFKFLYQCSGTECAGSLPKVPRPGRRTVYDEPEHASALSSCCCRALAGSPAMSTRISGTWRRASNVPRATSMCRCSRSQSVGRWSGST